MDDTEISSEIKPDRGLFWGIIFGVAGVLFFALQSNGVDVNWIWSTGIYTLCAVAAAWTTTVHALPRQALRVRIFVALIIFFAVGILGTVGVRKQYDKDHPKVAKGSDADGGKGKPGVPAPAPTHKPGGSERPILIQGTQVVGDPHAGGNVTLRVYIANNAHKVIHATYVRGAAVGPNDPDASDVREHIEEQWRAVENMKKTALPLDIPSSVMSRTYFDVSMDVTSDEASKIKSGASALYFMGVIGDKETNKDILGFCYYLTSSESVAGCRKHNFP